MRATRSGRLFPAPCFCFRQQPIAETIMRPPVIRTLRVDILPVLYESRNNQEMRGEETATAQTRPTHFYNTNSQQILFWSSCQQCNEKARSKVHSPGAVQMLRPRAKRCYTLAHNSPCCGTGQVFRSRAVGSMLTHRVCLSRVRSPSGSALRVSLGVFLQM